MCKIDLPFTSDHEMKNNDLFKKFAFESKVKSARAYLYFRRESITKKLLYRLKYDGKKEIGLELGSLFAGKLVDLDVDIIVPVPLHRSKKRKRGYNQSEWISMGLERVLQVPVRTDLIGRRLATQSQTKKSKISRWAELENVYGRASKEVSGKNILIVDDVITTGATVGMMCDRMVEQNVGDLHIAAIARGQ